MNARRVLVVVGLFILACAPRVLAPGHFVTIDEAYHWFGRVDDFLKALVVGDYAGTNLVGHPGVTTMWLGALGSLLHRALAGLGWVPLDDPILHRALVRLPVAVVASVAAALAYLPLRRLLGWQSALLACLLWAGDPFLIAHAKVLHTDALVTSFVMLSLLLGSVAFGLDRASPERPPLRWSWLIGSGVAAGLAFLTKSPSIILFPMVGLIAWLAGRPPWRVDRRNPYAPLLLWCVVALVVGFVLWPAAWVDPLGSVWSIVKQAQDDGGSPHGWGNFFWGHAVDDPGPFFYLVAIALRLTPWTLAGLVVAPLVLVWGKNVPGRRVLLLLAIFCVLFIGIMSVLPKKFDRYALPVFPALDIIAATALLQLSRLVMPGALVARLAVPRRAAIVFGLVVCVVGGNVAWSHPYEIAYYNQLLGGGPVAARLIPIGWGEGYEIAGAYIANNYEGCDRPTATWYGPALSPFVCGPVLPLDWAETPDRDGYAVLYIDQLQRDDAEGATAAIVRNAQKLETIRINGIDYAQIYQVLPAVDGTANATFGSSLRLTGYAADTTAVRGSGVLTATLRWQSHGLPTDEMLFFHVIGADGTRIAGADVPMIGGYAPDDAWNEDQMVSMDIPLPIPPTAPPGAYWLVIGVYNVADGTRLALTTVLPPNAPDDGPNALPLGPFDLP